MRELQLKILNKFLLVIGLAYTIGFILHVFDLFGARLNFLAMNWIWQSWILFLVVFDLATALGLFLGKGWGQLCFLMVAVSQLVAYTFFSNFFGPQQFLICFHVICLSLFFFLKIRTRESIATNFPKA